MKPTPLCFCRSFLCFFILGTNGSTSESFFSSWGLASLSNAVTSKGIELVSEGIDALETIGKKTMDVISEGDPGFRVKRDIFKKPSLSQVCMRRGCLINWHIYDNR